MNHVVLVGNLTDDPTLRYTTSGRAVANFTVAVSHREFRNGASQDVTDGFFPVTCWRALADHAAASFKKGSRVLVAGKLIQRTFETDDGKRTVIEIQAAHVGPELTFATAEITKATPESEGAVQAG
jgi:single-strand DNA-binding protein